jgi:hypothetical protein
MQFQMSFAVLVQMPHEVKNLYNDPVVNFLEEVSPQLIISSTVEWQTPEASSATSPIQFELQD